MSDKPIKASDKTVQKERVGEGKKRKNTGKPRLRPQEFSFRASDGGEEVVNKKKRATSELNLEMEVFFRFSTVK